MIIGVLPLIPVEPFMAAGHEFYLLHKEFALAKENNREDIFQKAREAGLDAILSPWCRGIYGLCKTLNIDTLIFPNFYISQELGQIIKLLDREGIALKPFSYPLTQNVELLRKEIESLCSFLETNMTAAEERALSMWPGRNVLRRIDGIQYRSCAYESREYHNALIRSLDMERDLLKFPKDLEGIIINYENVGRMSHLKVGIIGWIPFRENFFRDIEACDAVIVFDEFAVESNFLGAKKSLPEQYNNFILTKSMKIRAEYISSESKKRSIRGLILIYEAGGGIKKEEDAMRNLIPLPIFSVENRGNNEPLTNQELERLKQFIDKCRRI